MNNKQKIVVSIVGIFIVILALIGITYAYFLTRISGNTNTKSIEVTTADLALVYGDGNGLINNQNEKLLPGDEVMTKTFTVSNTGEDPVDSYVVFLDSVVNPLTRPQDLVYTVTCTSVTTGTSTVNGTCEGVDTETAFPTTAKDLVLTNNIAPGITHNYTFNLKYLNPNENQTEDMNKTFSARLNIEDIKNINTFDNNTSLLSYNIINNSMLRANGTSLVSKSSSAIGTQSNKYTISDEDETVVNKSDDIFIYNNEADIYNSGGTAYHIDERGGGDCTNDLIGKYYKNNWSSLDKGQIIGCDENGNYVVKRKKIIFDNELSVSMDNYGVSYFYRGNNTDNYINFAGMCWRIVRIQGDGSTKIILDDLSHECDNDGTTIGKDYVTKSEYGSITENVTNGIFYAPDFLNSTGGLADALKTFQATLSTAINTTYNNTKSIESTLKNGDWCVDYSTYADEIGTEPITDLTPYKNNLTPFYYGSYVRLKSGSATLKCPTSFITKYKDNTNMYVGAITAEELGYAGASINSGFEDGNQYLVNYKSSPVNYEYLTLSPSSFYTEFYELDKGNPFVGVSLYNGIYDAQSASEENEVRPSIILANNVTVTGNGTQTNPYRLN